jgi:hypothetical protein
MLQEEKVKTPTEEEPSNTFKILANVTFIIIVFSICGFVGSLLGLSINIALMNNYDNCTIVDKRVIYYSQTIEIDLLVVYNADKPPLWMKKNFTAFPEKERDVGQSYKCRVKDGSITWNTTKNYVGRIIMFGVLLGLFSSLCCTCLILDLLYVIKNYKKNLLVSQLHKQKEYSEFDKDF